MSAKPKKPGERLLRVWIELDKPQDAAHAQELCDHANRMMVRLNDGQPTSLKFWPSHRKGVTYCLTTSSAGTYTELADNGYWFNLAHLGREE